MKFKNYPWPLFFLLLGMISILGQVVLLREITTLFYGNEIFYGLGLGAWMLFAGLGSLLAIKLKFLKNFKIFLVLILGGLFILLPTLVVFLRWLVVKLIPFGQLPSPKFSFLAFGTIFFTFCFLLGAEFTLAALAWQKEGKKKAANSAYFFETVGFALGGLFFSFILATTCFPLWIKLNQLTLSWRHPDLIKVVNSNYQQIIVSKSGEQLNFFLGGQLAFTTQESFETRQILSLITPFTKKTNKTLVLGNPNIATEVQKKYFPTNTTFLEIDSKLLELEKDILPKDINFVSADPRRFLRQNENQWDLIVFSPGNPQTLLSNRYFTKECFQQIKDRLNEGGIFALLFYLPTDYQSEETARFGSSIYQTLKVIFPYIELLTPEDQPLFIASITPLKIDKTKIDPFWNNYFWYQFESLKRVDILKRLDEEARKINTDFEPISFFYQQLFWQTIFSFSIPRLMIRMVVILPLILLSILLIFLIKGSRALHLGLLASSSSFVLISIEILVILIFQTKIGYLYSQISLIFATILLGMAAGVAIINRQKNIKVKDIKAVFLGYLLILFLFLLILGGKMEKLTDQVFFWLLIVFSGGVIGGGIFALINQIYLQKDKNTGFIYAFDLFGGFFGAILTGSFLLPYFGIDGLIKILTGVLLINLVSFTAKPPGLK